MRYVALLRGVNVGGNTKVPMPELKELLGELSFDNVKTYINSGNWMRGSTYVEIHDGTAELKEWPS